MSVEVKYFIFNFVLIYPEDFLKKIIKKMSLYESWRISLNGFRNVVASLSVIS